MALFAWLPSSYFAKLKKVQMSLSGALLDMLKNDLLSSSSKMIDYWSKDQISRRVVCYCQTGYRVASLGVKYLVSDISLLKS